MKCFEKMWLVFGKTHGKTQSVKKPSKFKEKSTFGLNVTIRREMGRDIDGACGQLRRSYLQADT